MTTYQTLLIETDDDLITTLTINRPDKLNALSRRALTELRDFLIAVGETPQADRCRGIVLTGAGEKAFVAGADIAEQSGFGPAEGEEFGRLGQEVTELFEAVPVPVLAAVNGYALGGGCEMAMAADYIFASANAVFGQPEVNLGLIPGFGGCVRLQQYVGPGRARELIYTGRTVRAEEALRIGLVNEVFGSVAELLEAARASLALAATKSPVAVAATKQVINDVRGLTTAEGLGVERKAFAATFGTADMVEGTTAFLEKRTPVFTGE